MIGTRWRHLKNELDRIAAIRLSWLAGSASAPAKAYAPTMDDKRRAAQEVIREYARLAAANAFNPVPFLDLGVDVGLLVAMAHSVAAVYEVAPQELAPVTRPETALLGQKTVKKLRGVIGAALARRLLAAALPRVGLEALAKESCKWLPLAGTLVAARLGYRMAQRVGAKVVEHCETLTQQPPALDAMPS